MHEMFQIYIHIIDKILQHLSFEVTHRKLLGSGWGWGWGELIISGITESVLDYPDSYKECHTYVYHSQPLLNIMIFTTQNLSQI